MIPRTSFTLYREKYVYVSSSSPNWGGSNKPLGPGWYPDALIPFTDPETGKPLSGATLTAVPFNVKAGNNQPIWVDLLVPQNAKPGQYSGTYTVTSDQGTVTGQISLTVWNFTSADDSVAQVRLPFQSRGNRGGAAGTIAQQDFSIGDSRQPDAAHERPRIELPRILALSAEPMWATARWRLRRRSANSRPGPPGNNPVCCCTITAPMKSVIARTCIRRFSSGRTTCTRPVSTIWFRFRRSPRLYSDGSGTGRSAVDIWVLLPVMYNNSKSEVDHVLKKGDSVWSYNTLVQDAYSPKWEIDFDPVNFRIQPGFINQSLNLTGLLYWRIDRWTSDPWNNVNNTGAFSSANYPGEGMLVYPGQQVGVPGRGRFHAAQMGAGRRRGL